MQLVQTINTYLSLATIAAQALGVLVLAFLIFFRDDSNKFLKLLGKYGLHLIFITAVASTVGSIVYSEVLHFVPCELCWIQRIFLFPVVIIAGIAMFRRDSKATDYVLGLSIPGLVVAAYNDYLQFGGTPFFSCAASAAANQCAKRLVYEFGYITLPMMAATAFTLIILFAIAQKWYVHQDRP